MVRNSSLALLGIVLVLLALVCPARLFAPSESQNDADLTFEDAESFIQSAKNEQSVVASLREKRSSLEQYNDEFGSGDFGVDTFRASIYLNDRMHPEYNDPNSLRYESLKKRIEMELNTAFQQLSGTWHHHITSVGDSGNGKIKISIDFVHTEGDEDEYDVKAVLSEVLRNSNNVNANVGLLELRRVDDLSSGRCAAGEELCPNGDCVPRCDGVPQCVGGGDEIGCDQSSSLQKESAYRASVALMDRYFTSHYLSKTDEKYMALKKDIENQLTDALVRDGLVKATVKSFGIAAGNRIKVEIELLFRDKSVTTLESHRSRFVNALQNTETLKGADKHQIHFRAVRDVHNDPCLAMEAVCDNGQCVARCDGVPDCDGGEDELGCPKIEELPSESITPDSIEPITEVPSVETEAPGTACKADEFSCGGICVSLAKSCDGVIDCPGGEDENPQICSPTGSCTNEQFKCSDGKCIDAFRRCDYIQDCDDNDDELSCHEACEGSGMFTCDDGDTCIDDVQICDGTVDCDDGSDELECGSITTQPPPVSVSCRAESEFQCADGTCLSIDLKCNGQIDCPDQSDENRCHPPTSCSEAGVFMCSPGACISGTKVCDGVTHCSNRKDELNCNKKCGLKCSNGTCISEIQICNNINDCDDGSDERNCPTSCEPDQFKCNDGSCLSSSQRCDGNTDCSGGEDESSCSCRSSEFLCSSGQCVDIGDVCNGYDDCYDGSDERNCQSSQCTENQFRCGDGMCVDQGWRCDGISDCNDSSDEIGCSCNLNEFQCGTGECIAESFACDTKEDCRDGSDERGCPCKEGEFACRGGGCVPQALVCNRDRDCSDGSDEDAELCTKCASYQFECSSGECIFATQRCNGRPECADRSDEHGCPGIPSCGSYEFQCGSGDCISQTAVCDRRNDCMDSSDEFNCTASGGLRRCDSREFSCFDGTCVNLQAVCDGYHDCYDGSDELSCSHLCGESQFTCDDGQCISKLVHCDGTIDCIDGSDERDCGGASSSCKSGMFFCRDRSQCIDAAKRCNQQFDCQDRSDEEGCPTSCRLDEYKCTYGGCIPVDQRCNGNYDCPDGSDEFECPLSVPCGNYLYACADGQQCIDVSQRCDSNFDCVDKSDEENCADEQVRECRPDQYACRSGECIDAMRRCDNTYDCPDGTDEYGCATSTPAPPTTTTTSRRPCRLDEFTCQSGHCIPVSYRCNGNYDCRDGSDEFNCPPPSALTCSFTEFRCHDGLQCISERAKCNGYFDCFDRSDEHDCSEICRREEFTCGSGECLEASVECDGTYHCSDGSDELNCPNSVDCAPSHEFACRDGRQCVAKASRCNRQFDCIDRSDEENCQDTFHCHNGDQIPIRLKCDSYDDCVDASDEYGCDTGPELPTEPSGQIKLTTIPGNQTIEQGRQVVFRCRDEGDTRAPVRWVRQGHNVLPPRSTDARGRLTIDDIQMSYSGDYYCEAQGVPLNAAGRRKKVTLTVTQFVKPTAPPGVGICSYNQTTCRSGMCIPKAYVCDGKFDCDDQSDEDRCNLLGCEPNEFECDNRRCVQKSWVCDSDDDCQDGSDERNCGPPPPGSKCEVYEFPCQTRDQCIPKYFVCDNEMDCIDGSDEFGCSKPIITEHPIRNTILELGQTYTITCRAVGMPMPELNWRYNWGHVPSTCTSTSVGGLGTLVCTNVQVNHQGAYSCEATNSLGRKFAIPDAILQVKETDSSGICSAPFFNSGAVLQRDCIRCFCFGVTEQCSSTGQFITQLPPAAGSSFNIIGVNQDQYLGTYVIRANEYPISASYVRTVSYDKVEIYIPDRARLGGPTDLLLYFSLPYSYTGSQLGSYGGYLRYKISHQVTGYTQTIQGPDAIIKGNNITIMYVSGKTFPADVDSEVEIRLWPGQWYKRVVNKGGRIQSQELATREDIMKVLQNVELILIRASFTDGVFLHTSLTSLQLDSISKTSTSLGRAMYAESCRCPTGYDGLSCEKCAPNYMRIYDGTFFGRCTLNISCGPTEFGDPANGIPCQLCPCPLTNPFNQFSQSCYLDADGQVTCNCRTGYSGRRCETCSSGYSGTPSIPGESCKPTGQCDKDGSYSTLPDPVSGLCRCKGHTTGPQCSQCKASAFHLNENNLHGCIRCFCMGVSDNCTSSNWYRTQEVIGFVGDTQGFLLVDQYQVNTIMNNLYVDGGRQELVYREFPEQSPVAYYWKLPRKFVKDKVTAYGGNLTYTFRYTASEQRHPSRRDNPFDVELYGNDVTMRYFRPQGPPEAGNMQTLSVPLYEEHWVRQDGQASNREHFLMALADLEYILIRATYSTNTTETGLKEVRLDYATSRNTGNQRAFAVESCDCPQGYKGLSCEDCAPGYTRDLAALYLGKCKICDCNDHSEECDPETGICMSCRNNRAGEFCERCAPGFTEDYTGLCIRRDGCSCDPRGSQTVQCVNNRCICKENVEGDECRTCRIGYFHLSEHNADGCLKCWCNEVTDRCASSYLKREQIPMNLFDNHNFTLTNRVRNSVVTDLKVDIAQNQLSFNTFEDLPPLETYYWSLPQLFTGNKLNSYGGYLQLKQHFESRASNDLFADADIIIVGANQKEFVWMGEMGRLANQMHKNISIQLTEENFSHNQAHARREDFLSALASVEAILVRATLSSSITTSSLRDVVMDTAVDYSSGQTRAMEVEQCSCPIGHIGNSCEDCAQGYYEDSAHRCQRCECSGKEQSCTMDQNRLLICTCLPGYTGERCELSGGDAILPTGVFEVRIEHSQYVVEAGRTVELICKVATPSSYQMTIAWDKERGTLPIRRVQDDRLGKLTITQVRPEDDGVYVCRASTGVQVKEDRTHLRVTGGPPPSKPTVVIDEQREELYVRIGEFIRVRCRVVGSPPPEVQWYRQDGQPLSFAVSQSNGMLTFNNPQRGDTGTYVCLGRNREGSAQATIIIHVEKESALPTPGLDYIIVQVPENVEAQAGSFVRISCTVPASVIASSYQWTRMQTTLPEGSSQAGGVLVIPAAKSTDSGMYTCTVTDSQGRIGKSTTDLIILPSGTPPHVRIQPDRQTVNQGTNAELKCIVVGEPQSTITWTKDNEQLSKNARIEGDILRIQNAEVSDRGLYRCTAVNTNGEGRSVAVLEVEMREPPVIEMYPDTRSVIRKGESASFLCHLTKGYPTPTITWARTDGKPLTQNTETPIGGVIKFYQVTGAEEGSYICTASNDAGRMTAIATLEIEALPVITMKPASRSITVKSGERIHLECSADGDPTPSVTWQRIQTNLPKDVPAKSVTPRISIYEVNSARITDQGIYQCSAQNNAGTTVERVQVIVSEALDLFPSPVHPTYQPQQPDSTSDTTRQFQVPLGGQFEFRCVIEGLESDTQHYTYEFRRSDGSPLPREHILGSRTLTVSNVDRSVQGEYACIITEISTRQAIITIYANLEVIDPPRITLEPARQVVRPGDNANLRCSVTGDQPITIKWSKQRGPMPPSVILNGGMLMFRGIQVTDAGKYLCEAVNPVGTAEAVAEVLVNERPLLTSLQQQVTLSEGQDGELRCIASGIPASAVNWIKDGTSLPNNFRPAGNILRIHQASSDNSGRYKCEANTQTGDYTFDYVELVVQRARALNVQVRASTDNVQLGDIVDLYCSVAGQPRSYIKWSKQGGDLPISSIETDGRLRLIDVDQNAGGVYVCSAQTSSGIYEMPYPLTIQNTLSATRSVETRSVQFGSTAVLNCGDPVSSGGTFSWSKQGGQLPSRAVIQEEFLEIPDVEANDSGTYVCSTGDGTRHKKMPILLVVTGVVPRFNGEAYLALPTLRHAYLFFDLEISLKPEREDGLLLYNSQRDGQGDFVSFGLNNSYAEFRFDVGSGPALLRSLRPLQMGKWHTVKLTRNRKEGTLSVNGGPIITGKSEGRFQGLDLIKPLYIGGIPDFSGINKEAGFSSGFVGCISQLVGGTENTELMRSARTKNGVLPCNTCSDNPCHNGGVCQEAYSAIGHKCVCSAGYSGVSCESRGDQCYAGVCGSGRCVNLVEGFECQCPFGSAGQRCEMDIKITEPSFGHQSYLAYRTPRALKRFSVGLKLKPSDLDDGVIMYCAQQEKGEGDFASLALRNRRVEFRFNTGTGTAVIKSDELSSTDWVKILANRTDQTGTLQINDGELQNANAPGSSRALNLRTPLYFGGVDKSQIEISPEVRVSEGFSGCMSNLEIMDQPVRLGDALQDSSNVDQCGSQPCSRMPCHNDGSCHPDENNNMKYQCICQPGFDGFHCELRSGICDRRRPCMNGAPCKDISESSFECQCPLGFSGIFCQDESFLQDSAAFSGNSWLELDRYMFPHDGISEQEFTLEFTTNSANGLLFWLGQESNTDGRGKDFLSLGVVDGYLEMSLGMGGEVSNVISDKQVDDGASHTVAFRKLGNEATINVDNERDLSANAPESSFSFNTYGNIFIGGTPDMELMTWSKFSRGFDGCIHKMTFGTRPITRIMDDALDGNNVAHCYQ